jgi:ABC-2 type transport system ATP-binding protein
VIEVRRLRKVYPGGVEAVKGVELEVGAGEVFGLLGPNDSGLHASSGAVGPQHRPRRTGPAP